MILKSYGSSLKEDWTHMITSGDHRHTLAASAD
jgi:hypothetical protein